jgi:hypothetical protein
MERRCDVQFHRRFLNWCWHSSMANSAPLATSFTISGSFLQISRCFPARRFVFLQILLWSINKGLPTALKWDKQSASVIVCWVAKSLYCLAARWAQCQDRCSKLTSAPVTSEVVGSIPSQTHSICDREGDSLLQRRFPPGLWFPPMLHYKSPNIVNRAI